MFDYNGEENHGDPTVDLFKLLSFSKSEQIGKLASYMAAAYSTYRLGSTIHKKIKKPNYDIIIEGKDENFDLITDSILKILPWKDHRSLRASTVKLDKQGKVIDDDAEIASDSYNESATAHKSIKYSYSGFKPQKINIGGYDVIVSYKETERQYTVTQSLVFSTKKLAGQAEIKKFLAKIVDDAQSNKTLSIFTANQWGEITRQAEIAHRPLDTIILPDKQMKALTDDMDEFLSKKDKYKEMALPYHRGYLFYGPPGTGKTSLIRGIATKYNLDLYAFSLANFTNDAQFLSAMSKVQPGSIVALEDIDVISAATDRTESNKKVTLAGLANGLDGLITPEGIVIILSTNKQKKLDPAIIRTGRTDQKYNIGYVVEEQIIKIFNAFYPTYEGELSFKVKAKITTSDIFNVCKENFSDPDNARKQIKKLIKCKTVAE